MSARRRVRRKRKIEQIQRGRATAAATQIMTDPNDDLLTCGAESADTVPV